LSEDDPVDELAGCRWDLDGYGVDTDADSEVWRDAMDVLGRECASAKLYAVGIGGEGDVDASVDDER
jgi:hypothetical protein